MGHRCLHSLFCIFLGAASAPFGVWGRCGVGEGVGFGVSDGVELLWGGGCYGVGEAMGWEKLWGGGCYGVELLWGEACYGVELLWGGRSCGVEAAMGFGVAMG